MLFRICYLARRENSSRALKIRAAFENFLFSLRSVNWLRIFLSRYPSSPPELSTDQWLGFLNNVHFDLHWISRSITLKAKEALGKSFAAGSKNPEIPLALSILAARTGETQEAEHWLKEALKLAPGRYFLEYDQSLSKIQPDAPLSIKKTASTISKMLAPSRPEPKK